MRLQLVTIMIIYVLRWQVKIGLDTLGDFQFPLNFCFKPSFGLTPKLITIILAKLKSRPLRWISIVSRINGVVTSRLLCRLNLSSDSKVENDTHMLLSAVK